MELALQAVGVTTALHAGSAHSVLSTARRQYRVLSMKIHPDKCGHPLAPSAFAVLSHAFSILSVRWPHASGSDSGCYSYLCRLHRTAAHWNPRMVDCTPTGKGDIGE